MKPDLSLHELVDFQARDHDFLMSHKKSMLLYDRGLGKTVVTSKVMIDTDAENALVLGPLNSMRTWRDHYHDWNAALRPETPVDVNIVLGTPAQRAKMWAKLAEKSNSRRLFVTSPASFMRDLKTLDPKLLRRIQLGAFDEAHRMRSRKSESYKVTKELMKHVQRFHWLTGTPMSRGPQDFFTMLNCIDPRLFSSYWGFVSTFCEVIDGFWGKEIVGPRNIQNFQALLRRYSRVRLKTDPEVAAQMQKSTRKRLYVNLNKHQAPIYKELGVESYVWTNNGEVVVASTSMEKVLRFRQLICCPAMLDPTLGVGAAFEDLLERLCEGDDEDRHTVIFVPFKGAFPHFRKALAERGFNVFELKGGISPDEQQRQIAAWRATKGIMLCTVYYAESFSLEPAKTSYFVGYDWDPNVNGQAEDRLLRFTTPYPVTHYYYAYEGTVDDDLCYTVNWKQNNINSVMQFERDY